MTNYDYAQLHERFREAEAKASLVDDLESNLTQADKDKVSLRAEMKRMKEQYTSCAARDKKTIRDLRKEIQESQEKSAARLNKAESINSVDVQEMTKRMEKLEQEIAELEITKHTENEYVEAPAEKKRKRHDETPNLPSSKTDCEIHDFGEEMNGNEEYIDRRQASGNASRSM
ncbi:hypothetical protein P3342_007117 [Pyrenophora teres f. teres]|nr:hypothetical protein P3342_007117 [Pyrenophora teres f. teres]